MNTVRLLRQPQKALQDHNQITWNRLMKVFSDLGTEEIDWDSAMVACSEHVVGGPSGFLHYCKRLGLLELIGYTFPVQGLTPLDKLDEKIAHLERELEKAYALIGRLTVEREGL
jgi:hypothetical protein